MYLPPPSQMQTYWKRTLSQPEMLRSLASRPMSEIPMSSLLFWLSLSKSSKPEPQLADQSKESTSQ
jgi:hypothetical protein